MALHTLLFAALFAIRPLHATRLTMRATSVGLLPTTGPRWAGAHLVGMSAAFVGSIAALSIEQTALGGFSGGSLEWSMALRRLSALTAQGILLLAWARPIGTLLAGVPALVVLFVWRLGDSFIAAALSADSPLSRLVGIIMPSFDVIARQILHGTSGTAGTAVGVALGGIAFSNILYGIVLEMAPGVVPPLDSTPPRP